MDLDEVVDVKTLIDGMMERVRKKTEWNRHAESES